MHVCESSVITAITIFSALFCAINHNFLCNCNFTFLVFFSYVCSGCPFFVAVFLVHLYFLSVQLHFNDGAQEYLKLSNCSLPAIYTPQKREGIDGTPSTSPSLFLSFNPSSRTPFHISSHHRCCRPLPSPTHQLFSLPLPLSLLLLLICPQQLTKTTKSNQGATVI